MAVLTNKIDGWLRTSPEFLDKVLPGWRKKFQLKRRYDGGVFNLFEEDEGGEVRLPRAAEHFFDKTEFEDLRTRGSGYTRRLLTSRFSAWEGQEEVIDSTVKQLLQSGGAILEAGCGRGKTLMACEIALRLGVPTCVLVHAEFLANQFVDAMGGICPEARIGRVKSDMCNTGDTHDLVIASTQSITNPKRSYPESFYSSFGLLIPDEVHRYAAEVWQTSISKFPAAMRLGLTATTDRPDGLWPVITNHIGEISATLEGTNLIPRDVYMMGIGTEIDEEQFDKPWLDAKMKKAKLLTMLAEHPGRNKIMSNLVMKAHAGDRRLIFFSERRKQLELVSEEIQKRGIHKGDIGFYVGGRKQHLLDEAARRPVIFSTYKMGEEGLNIPELDSLIMGTPRSRVTQMIGRILRKLELCGENKKKPVVVDPCDYNIEMLNGSMHQRMREYKKLGYPVTKTF